MTNCGYQATKALLIQILQAQFNLQLCDFDALRGMMKSMANIGFRYGPLGSSVFSNSRQQHYHTPLREANISVK